MIYKIEDKDGQIERCSFDLTHKIGEGATASVYKFIYKNEVWAAKIYHKDRAVNVDKLKAMLLQPPTDVSVEDGIQKYIQFTWVTYLIKDSSDAYIGFLMPFVDQDATNSLDTYYDPILIKRLKGIGLSALSLRIEIAINLCKLLEDLHAHGHFFIDIKPQNIRVYQDSNKVVLLDCDGFSIKSLGTSKDRFPAELISTDYIAPEVLKNNLSPKSLTDEQDRYGLAVLLFQLLNRGTHPFQGIVKNPNIHASTNDERAALGLYPHSLLPNKEVSPRPQSVHDLLLDETRVLFDKAFTSLSRPSAKDWKEHFKNILDTKKLTRCSSKPNDVRHIHFKGKECIGCKINLGREKANSPPPVKLTSNSSSNSNIPPQKNISSSHLNQHPTSSNNILKKSELFTIDKVIILAVIAGVIYALFYIFAYENKPTSSSDNKTPNSSVKPYTYSDKIDYLSKKSNSINISPISLPDQTSLEIYQDISDYVLERFSVSKPTKLIGNTFIHENLNLSFFLSGASFSGTNTEYCKDRTYKIVYKCEFSGSIGTCTELDDIDYKSYCLEYINK